MAMVRFFAPDTDAYVDSVLRHRQEFESKFGHRLQTQIIPSDDYFSNQIAVYLTSEWPADVYMSGPVLLWQHMAAGLVEPLDRWFNAAGPKYQADDFLPSLLAANMWSGKFGDPLGTGPLLEIPVNCESYNLAYEPALLKKAGVGVPATWEEFFRASAAVRQAASQPVRGFGQRGTFSWHTVYTGYATQFWSYGATDFDTRGKCVIDSPEGIPATEDFIQALRSSGPAQWPSQRWYELALDFAQGRYGLMVDSDHYVAFFENPLHSARVGKLGYALPPKGPTGLCKPNLWTWSLVMNTRSLDKNAAWDFIEWASGKAFLLRSAFEGNMNPTRRSVWSDPSFLERTRAWGSFRQVSQTLVEDLARVLVTPSTCYLEVAERWTAALHHAYSGEQTVAEALGAAARDIDAIVGARS
jgi:multiple sugar transport system substrate-binding protein